MGNVFGKVPAYTTIGYWTQELGLSVYKESCSLFKDKRYALIVDESMMIGSEKLLLTLAMPAINAGSAITEKNVTIVDISIAKSWNGTSIKNVLEKVADKIGHKPEYAISDNGSTVCKAVRDALNTLPVKAKALKLQTKLKAFFPYRALAILPLLCLIRHNPVSVNKIDVKPLL